jgi:hypothetical protein
MSGFVARALPAFLLLAACNSTPSDTPARSTPRTPEMEAKYKEAVARGEVKMGMTRREVEEAIGAPQRKDRTTYMSRQVERWNYPYSEIYFDRDGYVLGWRSAGY